MTPVPPSPGATVTWTVAEASPLAGSKVIQSTSAERVQPVLAEVTFSSKVSPAAEAS